MDHVMFTNQCAITDVVKAATGSDPLPEKSPPFDPTQYKATSSCTILPGDSITAHFNSPLKFKTMMSTDHHPLPLEDLHLTLHLQNIHSTEQVVVQPDQVLSTLLDLECIQAVFQLTSAVYRQALVLDQPSGV